VAKLYDRRENVLEVQQRYGSDLLYHHAKYSAAGTSSSQGRERKSSVFVFLSVTLMNGTVGAYDYQGI